MFTEWKLTGPGLDGKILLLVGAVILLSLVRSEVLHYQKTSLAETQARHFKTLCADLEFPLLATDPAHPEDWCGKEGILIYRRVSENIGETSIIAVLPLQWGEGLATSTALGANSTLSGDDAEKQVIREHLARCPLDEKVLNRLPVPSLVPMAPLAPPTAFGEAARVLWPDQAKNLSLQTRLGSETPAAQAQIILTDLKTAAAQLNCNFSGGGTPPRRGL